MTLTAEARAQLRVRWRELARRVRHYIAQPDVPHPDLDRLLADCTKWVSPTDNYADSFMLFGFARLATAIVKTRVADFGPRGRVVAAVAEMVAEILGDEPEPPRLPFRADIDG